MASSTVVLVYVKGREATTRNSEQARKTMICLDKHKITKQIRKCMHHQTMPASLKYTSRATESIYMRQAIPRMHMNMRNSANCKPTATPIAMRKSSRNVEGMSRRPRRCRASRGNLMEASETPGAQGKLGRQWEGQEAGRAQAFGSTWKHSGMASSNMKKLKNVKTI